MQVFHEYSINPVICEFVISHGRTAVVNNDQIVEAVQIGVYGAFRSAMNDNSRTNPSIARVYLDGRLIASAAQV